MDIDLPDVDLDIDGGCGLGIIAIVVPVVLIVVLVEHWHFAFAAIFLIISILATTTKVKDAHQSAKMIMLWLTNIAFVGMLIWGVSYELDSYKMRRIQQAEDAARQAEIQAAKEDEQKRIGAIGRLKKWALGDKDYGKPEKDQ